MTGSCNHIVLKTKSSQIGFISCFGEVNAYSVVDVQTENGRVAAEQIAKMVAFAVFVSPQFDFLVIAAGGEVITTFVVSDRIHLAIVTLECIPRSAESE